MRKALLRQPGHPAAANLGAFMRISGEGGEALLSGWYIGQHARLMDHWRAVLPETIITVRLADWVEDFDRTLARVLDQACPPTRTAPASASATAAFAP
jgi:hypothetical protein